MQAKPWDAGHDPTQGDLEVLTFDLSGEIFALEAVLVREVLDQCPETQVPGASGFVDAVINFRGRIVPLADLRMAFGLTQATTSLDSRVIVIEFEIEGEALLVVPALERPAAEVSPAGGLGGEIAGWAETQDPYALIAARMPAMRSIDA